MFSEDPAAPPFIPGVTDRTQEKKMGKKKEKKTEYEEQTFQAHLKRVAARRAHNTNKDQRITRQRRELKRLNLAYLAQYGRATRLARDYDLVAGVNAKLRDQVRDLMGERSKMELAWRHGRQALKPKVRAKFDAEYNRIMKGETDEQN